MPHPGLTIALSRVRRAATGSADAAPSDGRLLTAFLAARDETAFAELVARHGSMVFAVCRRLTGHHQDAEDAFQAVFVVLARRAGAVVPREAVGNWLYGVAVRCAREARVVSAKRRAREVPTARPAAVARPNPEPAHDLGAVLHEELAGLPDKFRTLLVLCDLEGVAQTAVASRLGLPVGTVYSRLAAARQALAGRLKARGIGLSAAGLALALAQTGQAAVPAELRDRVVAVAISPDPLPAAVAAVSHGVLRTMLVHKLKLVPVAVGFVAAVVFAAGLLPAAAARPKPNPPANPGSVPAEGSKPAPPAAAPKPAGAGKLLVLRTDRFEFRSPGGAEAGAPPAHPFPALFFAGRLSPGGKWFAYVAHPQPGAPKEEYDIKGPRLFIRDLTAKDKPTAVDISVRHICWSPDGSKLLAVEHPAGERDNPQPGHWLIDPKTGEKVQLSLPPGHVHDWAPDGTGFLMSVLDAKQEEARLAVVSRDGKTETTLYRMKRPCWLEMCRYSPDGRTVLLGLPADEKSDEWLKSLPRLFLLDVATKQKREVAEVPLNASVTVVCWSPDGKRIAYLWRPVPEPLTGKRFSDLTEEERVVETEEFVVVADADGKNAKVVTSDKGPQVNSLIITGLDWR
jgi:RNA polymerase sigma factor (sigma-70 family)